jgi:hypothetical protein
VREKEEKEECEKKSLNLKAIKEIPSIVFKKNLSESIEKNLTCFVESFGIFIFLCFLHARERERPNNFI